MWSSELASWSWECRVRGEGLSGELSLIDSFNMRLLATTGTPSPGLGVKGACTGGRGPSLRRMGLRPQDRRHTVETREPGGLLGVKWVTTVVGKGWAGASLTLSSTQLATPHRGVHYLSCSTASPPNPEALCEEEGVPGGHMCPLIKDP